jgi:tRNA pseudouridine55 synthase
MASSPESGPIFVAEGFLLVDKAGGWTSHDVVARVRGLLKERKIGHAGTLDPMATGLLLLAVGKTTRLLRYVQQLPKTYVARMIMGVATDTLDADGAVLAREPMPVSEEEVRSASRRFVGTIQQIPPMVSAVRLGGRRLYELARQGREVERAARTVQVFDLDIIEFSPCDYPEVTLRVRCGSGTYIRTLADDIARALGGRAHLSSLRRHRIGSHAVDQAHAITDIEESVRAATAESLVIDAAQGLRDLPAVRVSGETERAVTHGAVFAAAALGIDSPASGPHLLLNDAGKLLAVYGVEGRRARAEVVLG